MANNVITLLVLFKFTVRKHLMKDRINNGKPWQILKRFYFPYIMANNVITLLILFKFIVRKRLMKDRIDHGKPWQILKRFYFPYIMALIGVSSNDITLLFLFKFIVRKRLMKKFFFPKKGYMNHFLQDCNRTLKFGLPLKLTYPRTVVYLLLKNMGKLLSFS